MTPPSNIEKVSPAVEALCERGNVTWEESNGLNLNGWERDRLLPHMDREALCKYAEQLQQHCVIQRRFPPVTYEEALIHRVLPLLIARLRAKGVPKE